ncbi:ABC transporter ATP-binding protein [Halovivax gelatinilyticus]|uniref:ABC transporter ATP-binding protein n=1 Tax=Halovivax gelatinilyticus TaxID=2961597 RepID=UPI0020CA91A0|nr:ABC transporter ATP-binding protein [Halovivax gelatinilyticus]
MTSESVAIESRGLEKSFDGGDRILQGTDLTVDRGEIVLVMGPNGVGKTVLLSCLAGGEAPTAGTIEIFGSERSSVPNDALAFMLQNSMLEPKLTGRENLAFYRDLHPRFTDRWRTYVQSLEIEEALDTLVENYSEGMKRKLEFATVLSGEVELYLLDEPTAGVDLTNVQRFHDAIVDRKERGKTFVVSSHRPMDAAIADRIAFMPDGTISAVGTPTELLNRVPTVVTVSGRAAMQVAESFTIDETLFPIGGEARGFLPAETSVSEVADVVAETDGTIETIEPTYTDLFNYYVHIEGSR